MDWTFVIDVNIDCLSWGKIVCLLKSLTVLFSKQKDNTQSEKQAAAASWLLWAAQRELTG